MPKKLGIAMVVTGAALILSALLLFYYNRMEDDAAGQEAESLLNQVQAVIQDKSLPSSSGDSEEIDNIGQAPEETVPETRPVTLDPTMTVTEINGYAYVGYLSIPDLRLELPVMSDWDYVRLKTAPCRHFGSTKTDDLVIAAHNYQSHFGRLKELEIGDAVTFTDMDGEIIDYTVSATGTVAPTDVEAVVNSGHDLVLYTCTPGGQTRVCVFCDRIEADTEATTAVG